MYKSFVYFYFLLEHETDKATHCMHMCGIQKKRKTYCACRRAASLSARFFSFLSLTPRVRSASSTLISMRRCTTVTAEQVQLYWWGYAHAPCMTASHGHCILHHILMAETRQELTVLICSARLSQSLVNIQIRFSGSVIWWSRRYATPILEARQPQLIVHRL